MSQAKIDKKQFYNDRLDLNPFSILPLGENEVTIHKGSFTDAAFSESIDPTVGGSSLTDAWLSNTPVSLTISSSENVIYFEVTHPDKTTGYTSSEAVPITSVEITNGSSVPTNTSTKTYLELATVSYVDIGADSGYQKLTPNYNLNSDVYIWIKGDPV